MAQKSDLNLTRNQALVFGTLDKSKAPLSAYAILDQLRDEGIRAPLQIYRALEKLREFGLVHRLESLNAFVACRHSACNTKGTTVFMICETCERVTEVAGSDLDNHLQGLAEGHDFRASSSAVEVRGSCSSCN